MSCFNKELYKVLKRECKEQGIIAYSVKEDGPYSNYNGISVAYRPMSTCPGTRMVEVAVSYCAPDDEYKKKHGKYQAMKHFSQGATIQLPIRKLMNESSELNFSEYLISLFCV